MEILLVAAFLAACASILLVSAGLTVLLWNVSRNLVEDSPWFLFLVPVAIFAFFVMWIYAFSLCGSVHELLLR
jgi:hypothetical protein